MGRLGAAAGAEVLGELACLGAADELDAEAGLDVVEDRARLAGRGDAHGDVVLLVRARGDGVHRGGVRVDLVLAGDGRRRVLGDHQAGVQAGPGREERGQAREVGVHELLDPALGDVREGAERQAQVVEDHRQRLAVEQTRAEDLAGLRYDQRVVRDGVELRGEHVGDVGEGGLDRPVDLRDAAQ